MAVEICLFHLVVLSSRSCYNKTLGLSGVEVVSVKLAIDVLKDPEVSTLL